MARYHGHELPDDRGLLEVPNPPRVGPRRYQPARVRERAYDELRRDHQERGQARGLAHPPPRGERDDHEGDHRLHPAEHHVAAQGPDRRRPGDPEAAQLRVHGHVPDHGQADGAHDRLLQGGAHDQPRARVHAHEVHRVHGPVLPRLREERRVQGPGHVHGRGQAHLRGHFSKHLRGLIILTNDEFTTICTFLHRFTFHYPLYI